MELGEIYNEYVSIHNSGFFWVWLPGCKGNWQEDISDFAEYYVTKCFPCRPEFNAIEAEFNAQEYQRFLRRNKP